MEAERRQITVLFTDMVDFTAFSERAGEESAFTLMRSLAQLMEETVKEQGGVVQSFTGDGVMAVFGAPVAVEDAPLRACRAALTILDRVAVAGKELERKHGVHPRLRIGINSGPAVVGQVQGGIDANITVLGDTVNLASRVQALADPNSAVMTESTYRLVQGMVEARYSGDHIIKGKSDRQKIYQLDRIRFGARQFDKNIQRGLTTFVGRRGELDQLRRHIDGIGGRVRFIDIVGEPGIGKSRLTYELQESIDRSHILLLVGGCTPDGQQTPFLPFVDVVRTFFLISQKDSVSEISRKLEKGLAALALNSQLNLNLLLNLLGLKTIGDALKGLDGVLIGLRTRDLLLLLLESHCRIMPVVVLLEDLHWADRVTEELLARISGIEHELALLVVHTHRPEYRPSWTQNPSAETIALSPLSEAETSRIIQLRLGVSDLPGNLSSLITGKAEGNPLFTEEIATFLLERGIVKQSGGLLVYDSEAVAKALPNSVQLLLHARIDRLKPEDRALLQSASVVGRRFSLDLIGVLTTDAANAFAKLSVMEELDLIYKDNKSDEYVFKHSLIRDALYDSLLRQPRESLHLKIAMEIESRNHNNINEVVEVLAHHFYLANETERAFHYMVLAGRKSVGTYSLEEAEYYFKNALNLYDSSSILVGHRDFVELVGNLAHLFNLMFRPNEVKLLVDKYVSDLEKLADSQRLVRILYDYAQATALMCLYRTSVGTAERMFVIAERLGDDRSLAYARAGLIGATTMFEGLSIEEAERHGQLALIESQRVDDAHLRNIIMVITGWDYLQRGLTDKGRERTMQLQVQGRDTNDPRALGASLWILGWHNIIDERYDEALSCGEECIRVAIAPWDYEIGILVIGVAQIFLGDVDKGSERLWQSRSRGESKEYHHTKAVVDGPLGVAMVLKGDISKGIRFMEAAIERNRKEGNMVATDVARLYLAETLIEILRPKQKPRVNVLLRNLPQLLKLLFIGSKKAIGLLLQARKNPMWTEHTYYRARVDADLGVLYSMNKQIDLARSYLEQARSVANQLAAKALLARIDSALAKLS